MRPLSGSEASSELPFHVIPLQETRVLSLLRARAPSRFEPKNPLKLCRLRQDFNDTARMYEADLVHQRFLRAVESVPAGHPALAFDLVCAAHGS